MHQVYLFEDPIFRIEVRNVPEGGKAKFTIDSSGNPVQEFKEGEYEFTILSQGPENHRTEFVASVSVEDASGQEIGRQTVIYEVIGQFDPLEEDCLYSENECEVDLTMIPITPSHQNVAPPPPSPVGLDAYLDLRKMPMRKHGVFSYSVTSNGRVSAIPDVDTFLYIEGKELVMLEDFGAGCIYSTCMYWGGPSLRIVNNEKYRFIVRIDDQIAVNVSLRDLGSGKVAPFLFPIAGFGEFPSGHYSNVPMVFHRHVRISLEATHDDTSFLKGLLDRLQHCVDYMSKCEMFQYWEFVVHRFNFVPNVPAFTGETTPELLKVLQLFKARGLAPPFEIPPSALVKDQAEVLTAGSTVSVMDFQGAGAVLAFHLNLDSELEEDWNNVMLEMTWDHAASPHVFVPLGAFFGGVVAGSTKEVNGLMVGMQPKSSSRRQKHFAGGYCYFPMPFWQHARITLHSRLSRDIDFWVRIEVSDAVYPRADTGYFTTYFHGEAPNAFGVDFPFFDPPMQGSWGHIVYNAFRFRLEGGMNHLGIEGDHRFWLDDNQGPQWQTTGLEDYYLTAHCFAFSRNFSLPLHGAPMFVQSKHLRWMEALLYRSHLAETIVFNQHAHGLLEVGESFDPRDVNCVPGQLEVVMMYYSGQQTGFDGSSTSPTDYAGWEMTDELDVGDPLSRQSHGYTHLDIYGQAIPFPELAEVNSSYTGHFDRRRGAKFGGGPDGLWMWILDTGYEVPAQRQISFKLTLRPGHRGLVLRRRLDYARPHQKAEVYVDGARAGTWYDGGYNDKERWRDSHFLVPLSVLDAQRAEVLVTVVPQSMHGDVSDMDPVQAAAWTEFHYWAYCWR